ncbi:MAG: M48 family metalloprotease [Syntrophobacteraceae bacterium]
MFSVSFRHGGTRAAIAALTLFLFTAVSLVPLGPAWALTLSEENKIGRLLLTQVRKQMPLIEDGDILTYVRGVANRVAKEVGISPYQYQFFIIDKGIPNAFAVPGGYIFMFRGLIEMMASEGELASIFAHEIAHIQARHIHRRMEEGKVLGIAGLAGALAGIFLGGAGMGQMAPAIAVGSMAASTTAALRYSRAHEMEADQLGFRFLCKAGYDPADMVSIMHKMDQIKWSGSSSIPSYLSTHPALGERVLYLKEMVKKQKAQAPKSKKAQVGDFPFLHAALIADYDDQAKAYDRFQIGIKKGDKAAGFGLGRLYLRQEKTAEAAEQLRESARMTQSPFVLSCLGSAYHRLGKLDEALRTFQSALALDPSASIVHYKMALVLQEKGQKSEAIEHLQQVEELAPMFPEVDYQLGILLGQTNRLGMAHYYLGRYYMAKQDTKLALMHYKKAKGSVDSPAKIDEISETLKVLETYKKESGNKGK